jgi:N-acyl homoserine lactone hydrolase
VTAVVPVDEVPAVTRTLRLVAIHAGDIVMDVDRIRGGAPGHKRNCPIMSFIVDDGTNVLLFDTGMNLAVRHDPVGYWGRVANRVLVPALPDGADLLSRLREAGYPPESVTLVINSHLHNDHAGLNREFPSARVLVRRREWDYALTQMDVESSGYVRNDFYSSTSNGHRADAPEVASLELFDYEDQFDVLGTGAAVLVSTIGHTPGHQSLLVTFPSGVRFALTGDAAYTAEDLRATSAPAVAWDPELAAASSARLRALQADGATVLVCHDEPTWSAIPSFVTLHEEPL